jgi:hypothetical protein
MFAVRMLFLMMSIPTSLYIGIITGLAIPAFVYARWSPRVRSYLNPSASNIATCVCQSVGASLGMSLCDQEREWDANAFGANGLRRRFTLLRALRLELETTSLHDFIKRPPLKARFDKQLNRLDQVVQGFFLGAALAGHIYQRAVRYKELPTLLDRRWKIELKLDLASHVTIPYKTTSYGHGLGLSGLEYIGQLLESKVAVSALILKVNRLGLCSGPIASL